MSTTTMRIRGVHVLFAMLAFFATVIAVNITFVVLALQSFPGEDVRRSYMQGLNYNETLAERRAQAALGWTAAAGFIQQDGAPAVEVTLRDSAGQPIDGLVTTGELRWPASERLDHSLHFTPRGEGRYVASLQHMASGRWQLRAHAQQSDSRALDFEAELTWPSQR